MHSLRRVAGFTLVEMMVVVSIIAILAAIAIPIYTNYIHRSKQSEAKSTLLTIKLEQEQYRAENDCYTINFNAANFPQAFRLAANGRVYTNVSIVGAADPGCAANETIDFQAQVDGPLAGGNDIWGISDLIPSPVHCDGRPGYTPDQTASCSGRTTALMEY